MGWNALRVGCRDNHAKSASAHVLCGQSAGSPWGEARGGRALLSSEASVTAFRNHSRRPGAVSVKKGLGQRHGMERAPRWLQRQPRQVRQRARDVWVVGLFSTGQSARGLRATDFENFDYGVSKLKPPTWRGVGDDEPRHTVWGGARPALAAKKTTQSPPERACPIDGRSVFHRAKCARAARHGARKLCT